MAIAHQLFFVVIVVSALMPMAFSGLSLPPATWSPVEGPRISKQEGEYCFSYDPSSVVAPHLWFRVCGSFYTFYGDNQSPVMIHPSYVWYYCDTANRLRYNSDDSVSGTLENDETYNCCVKIALETGPIGPVSNAVIALQQLYASGYYTKFTDIKEERYLYGVPGYANTGFKLGSVHIHIGARGGNLRRTEHEIFGKQRDAEVHMVHSRGEGSGQVAGLAVISIFLSLTEGEENEELNRLLDKVENIQKYEGEVCRDFFIYCEQTDYDRRFGKGNLYKVCKGDYIRGMDYLSNLQRLYGRSVSANLRATAMRYDQDYCVKEDEQCPHHGTGEHDCGGVDLELNPEKLLPSPRHYFYYYGSLTTATLSESVLWQVMMEPLRITREQLERLESMQSRKPGGLISDFGNLRPLQNLNGRQIFANTCG